MLLFITLCSSIFSQISPGELSNAHSELDGLSNCTKCHELGKQVSKAKCLECHTEITDLLNLNRGYHSNKKVISKNCWDCHGEHYGKDFQIIRFNEKDFDHNESGFELKGKHKALECKKCHNPDLIIIEKVITRKNTFIGLGISCQNCHEDRHQGTLKEDCARCHTEENFKPASKFSHDNTKFKLTGKHSKVECINCHKKELKKGKEFQHFAGIKFKSCVNCHKDEHKGNFGNDCKSCHNTNSFNQVDIKNGFNHSKTNFPLLGKHNKVKCKNCHKENYTKNIKYTKCYDCHEDYHKGEFVKNSIQTDCKQCHSEKGFSPSLFTIERHALTKFELKFAHEATPCFACHKKADNWKFRINGEKCIDCHKNIHENNISGKFFDKNKCETCHTLQSWKKINFDHNKTEFELAGKHKEASCSNCHFKNSEIGIATQKFKDLSKNCLECHTDIHNGQFISNEKELCENCHTFDNWKPTLFDHNKTKFALDGAHNKLNCSKCHKLVVDGELKYIQYKNEETTCKSCHS